jgi:hypothetical protein
MTAAPPEVAPPELDSTLEALHARLDLTPDDGFQRQVIADRLDELGPGWSELAEGYRVLGEFGRFPYRPDDIYHENWWTWGTYRLPVEPDFSDLPRPWFELIWPSALAAARRGQMPLGHWCVFLTRRAADDAAARAWTRLTPAEKGQCLRELRKIREIEAKARG